MQKKTNKQHNKNTTQDDNNSDWHIYKVNNDYCRILLMSIPRRGRTNVQSISVWFNGFFCSVTTSIIYTWFNGVPTVHKSPFMG